MRLMNRQHLRYKIGVAVLSVAVAGWLYTSKASSGVKEYTVESMVIGKSLYERGILVSLDSVPVELRTSGEILELTRSGTRVRKGDVVALIDESERADQLADLQLEIENARMDKEVSEAEFKMTKLKEENRLKLLKEQLDLAKLEEATALAGLPEEDRRQLIIRRETAQLDLEDEEAALTRQQRLLDKGFVSAAMLEPFERRASAAKAKLEEIKTELRLKEKGMPEEQLFELTRKTARISALLDRSTKAMERKLQLVQENININNAKIIEDSFHAANTQEEIAGAAIHAGADGIMQVHLYRDWRSGGIWREYKPGIKKWERDRIATIVNPGRMSISVMFHEADINLVAAGMPARIRLPAYPDQSFGGVIAEVGGVGRDRFDVAPRGYESDKSDVTMFNATVSLDGDGFEFRPGMSALVEIMVEKPSKRLVVDRSAVRMKDKGFVVLRKSILGMEERKIEGRYLDRQYFAVSGGLQAGDAVVVPGLEELP